MMHPGMQGMAPKMVKLTQVNGKKLMLPGMAIKLVETLSQEDVRKMPGLEDFEGKAIGAWLDTNATGGLLSAVLKDKFGWAVRQISDGQPRLELKGLDGKTVSVAAASIRGLQELDHKVDGEAVTVTLVSTHLINAEHKPINFISVESVDEIGEKLDDLNGLDESAADEPAEDPLD